jgi:hypothetical protein
MNSCLNACGSGCNSNNYMSCQQQNTYTQCDTYNSSVNGQSDAFIKAASQSGYNSTWSNNATRIEAIGVNHLEMRNHARMETIYREIFEGQHGDFFITPR